MEERQVFKSKSYLLVLLLSAITISLIFRFSDKYKVRLISKEFSQNTAVILYLDLDNDGLSEKLILENQEGKATILVERHSQVLGHWKFNGDYYLMYENFIDDYDNDGVKEIFMFTNYRDSLYLQCVDPINLSVELLNFPICKMNNPEGESSSTVVPGGFTDVDSDDIKEYFFITNSGYQLFPRNTYAFYPTEKKIYHSSNVGANFYVPIIFDLDEDGLPEIFSSCSATGNHTVEYPYSDMFCWLMVFNTDLSFKFSPIRLDEYPAHTEFTPFKTKMGNLILAYHWYKGTKDLDTYFALYDCDGRQHNKRVINTDEGYELVKFFSKDKTYTKVYAYNSSGIIYHIDEDLSLNFIAELPDLSIHSKPVILDFSKRKFPVTVFTSKNHEQLIICDKDFLNPVIIPFPERFNKCFISLYEDGSTISKFSVDTDNAHYVYSYSYSAIYNYWYFLVIIVIFAYWFITVFAYNIYEFRLMKKEHSRNQLAELQLKSVQNQIDPHFTFNLLESFGNLINENDKTRAQYIFDKYSGLLKYTVLKSEKVIITLKEELEFVTSYLDLEKFRFKNKFDYRISEIGHTDILIPKMLIHIFVENALKHGLKHLVSRKGELQIDVIQKESECEICISDNGIGRKKSAEVKSFSTGKGLEIIKNMLGIYENLYRKKIIYSLEDLYHESEPTGTRVVIIIPL